MANALYVEAKNSFLGAPTHSAIDLNADDIEIVLIDTGTYTVNLTTHIDFADLTGVVGTATNLAATLTVSAGAFDSGDTTISAVSGSTVEAMVLYKNSGTAGTSPLIAYYDTVTSGLPLTPNGGDVVITPHASGWFSL